MTALASTAPSPDPAPDSAPTREPAAAPRQTRWLLRLHRSALCVWAGIVVVVSTALLWLWGPLTDAAAAGWRQYDACGTAARCTYDQPAILLYKAVYQYATVAVLAVPFLVAAWAGATLIGRELETGTARLAWTQSVSPARWLANKLAVPAALIAVGTGLAGRAAPPRLVRRAGAHRHRQELVRPDDLLHGRPHYRRPRPGRPGHAAPWPGSPGAAPYRRSSPPSSPRQACSASFAWRCPICGPARPASAAWSPAFRQAWE